MASKQINTKEKKPKYKKQQVPGKIKKNKKSVLGNNILSVFILLFTLNLLIAKVDGYNWEWNKLLTKNLEITKKYNYLTNAQKHEIKQGFFYKYLDAIKTNTPEDAIILMPPDSIIDLVNAKYKLNNLKNRSKTTYFIYPRKVIYEKFMGIDSLYLSKITHVAIVNYYGYEKLNYKVKSKQQFSILPINLNNKKQ